MPMQKGMIVRNGVQYGGAVQTIKEEGSESIENFTSYDDDTIYNDFVAPVSTMESGESNASLFSKISKMFKNIRTIAKNLAQDINTINANLSGKVNKSGDTMSGNLVVEKGNPAVTFHDMDGDTERRHVWMGNENSSGAFYLWDSSHSKALLYSSPDASVLHVNGMPITPITYEAGNVPANVATATNGSLKNVYDMLNMAKGTYTGSLNNVGTGSSVLKPNSCVWITTSTTNKPSRVSYGVVTTFDMGGIILQVVYSISGEIFYREYYDSGAGPAWHAWHTTGCPLCLDSSLKVSLFNQLYSANTNVSKTYTLDEDAYITIYTGAGNNSTTSLVSLSVYLNGGLYHVDRTTNEPYCVKTWISPLLAAGTVVKVVADIQATSYTSDSKGHIQIEKYYPS